MSAAPTEPGWYWVELAGKPIVVEVGIWGRQPGVLGFYDPGESKPLFYAAASWTGRWGPRVLDWSPSNAGQPEERRSGETAPRVLARIREYLRRDHGITVQGDMFVHALRELVRPEPEPVLDAGWPIAVDPEAETRR